MATAIDSSDNRATQESTAEPTKNIINKLVQVDCVAVIGGVIAHCDVWFGTAGRFALRSIVSGKGQRVASVTFWAGPLFQERLQGGPALDPGFTAKLPPAPLSKSAQLRDVVLAGATDLFAGDGPDPTKIELLKATVERLNQHLDAPHPPVPS